MLSTAIIHMYVRVQVYSVYVYDQSFLIVSFLLEKSHQGDCIVTHTGTLMISLVIYKSTG